MVRERVAGEEGSGLGLNRIDTGLAATGPAAQRPATARPRKIWFLVTHSNAGGAQEVAANLAESFQARGHEVRLVALFPSAGAVRAVSAETPWSYVALRRPGSPFGLIGLLRSLTRLLSDGAPDVVFTALPAANVLTPIAVRLAGLSTQVVTTHHSPAETHSPLLNLLDGFTGSLKAVTAVVSVSHTVGRSHDGKPAAYLAKRRTITNALPPQIEQTAARLRAGRGKDGAGRRLVVATGRLAAQKNYPTLIRALLHLPATRLHIIGDGPDEGDLKALARTLGVSARVDFLGFRPRPEALALLAQGDVFAQPSLYEGHSLGLVEAARLGLPLVVSDAPVQIEGVTAPDGEVCGLVVGVHDDVALAGAIARLLDDPDVYRDYVARATRLGETTGWDTMLAAYERLAL